MSDDGTSSSPAPAPAPEAAEAAEARACQVCGCLSVALSQAHAVAGLVVHKKIVRLLVGLAGPGVSGAAVPLTTCVQCSHRAFLAAADSVLSGVRRPRG